MQTSSLNLIFIRAREKTHARSVRRPNERRVLLFFYSILYVFSLPYLIYRNIFLYAGRLLSESFFSESSFPVQISFEIINI